MCHIKWKLNGIVVICHLICMSKLLWIFCEVKWLKQRLDDPSQAVICSSTWRSFNDLSLWDFLTFCSPPSHLQTIPIFLYSQSDALFCIVSTFVCRWSFIMKINCWNINQMCKRFFPFLVLVKSLEDKWKESLIFSEETKQFLQPANGSRSVWRKLIWHKTRELTEEKETWTPTSREKWQPTKNMT